MYYHSDIDWLKKLFPNGLKTNESTLISGKGGTGKPLIEFALVVSWLKAGGSAIGIPMQYPSLEMVNESIKKLYDINLEDYKKQIAFISFNPNIDDIRVVDSQIIEANLIKPKRWESAVLKASEHLNPNQMGIMIFGSALNLLLFNDHYLEYTTNLVEEILMDSKYTILFTVSNNVYPERIKRWEEKADNLLIADLSEDNCLNLHVIKMKSVDYRDNDTLVPIDQTTLSEIEHIARLSRNKNIECIKKIK